MLVSSVWFFGFWRLSPLAILNLAFFFSLCVALEEVSEDNCCRSFPMVSFASLLKFHNAIRALDPSVMVTPQRTSKYTTDNIEIDDE